MKKYLLYFISLFVAIVTVFFATGEETLAATYPAGSLIKLSSKSAIYYVGSDNLKYLIPDEVTFKSWYDNFSEIKVLSSKDFNSVKTAKYNVTIRPIKQLVKFSNSNKVYVVDTAARLRWVVDEKTAKKYYDDDWNKKIVILSSSRFDDYRLASDLDSKTIFSKTRVANSSNDINAELKNRKVLVEKTTSVSSNNTTVEVSEPFLKYMSENLKYSLQPKFSSTVNNYFMNAQFSEITLNLKLAVVDKNHKIYVNDVPVNNASSIKLALSIGKNMFKIKVVSNTGKENIYNLEVLREQAANNSYLKSLTENLNAKLDPLFDPSIKEYEIKADYTESVLKLTLRADDIKSSIYVNEELLKSKYYGTKSLLLSSGENKIIVRVVAENGYSREYKLTVTRYKYPKLGDNDLSSLKISGIVDTLSPVFDPKQSLYYLQANEDEDRIVITAKAKNKNARVIIDGSYTTSKSVYLDYEENEIFVTVEISGYPEFTKKYKIRVYRDWE
ncbi:MAG: cadherin-like beta sandwich domain-containing protein [Candidatus Magasanikbacteria bacterium]